MGLGLEWSCGRRLSDPARRFFFFSFSVSDCRVQSEYTAFRLKDGFV